MHNCGIGIVRISRSLNPRLPWSNHDAVGFHIHIRDAQVIQKSQDVFRLDREDINKLEGRWFIVSSPFCGDSPNQKPPGYPFYRSLAVLD